MSKKQRKNESVSSFEVNENIFVDVYEWGKDEYSVKITISKGIDVEKLKVQLKPYELTRRAFDIYSNSDFIKSEH